MSSCCPRLLRFLSILAPVLLATGCDTASEEPASATSDGSSTSSSSSTSSGSSSSSSSSSSDGSSTPGEGVTSSGADTSCEVERCDSNASCVDNGGAAECVCDPGFEGDGFTCDDINECSDDPCEANASCTNTAGSFECACDAGYSGDGVSCSDVDECVDTPCDGNATCANGDGDFACTCNSGYSGDGLTCADINECDAEPCDANATCTDSPGSYGCACDAGYYGDGLSCSPQRLVFVTSGAWDGNLGGIAGADALCQAAADTAGIGVQDSRTFQAWIAAGGVAPNTRFVDGPPFRRLDGTFVATDLDDLTNASIAAPINIDENGAVRNTSVWTNVASGGYDITFSNTGCADFTSNSNAGGYAGQAWTGLSSQTNSAWTDDDPLGCNTLLALYCFEQ